MVDAIISILSNDAFKGIMLIVGALIAILSVYTARLIAKKKQAADFLLGCRNDDHLLAGLKAIRECDTTGEKTLAYYVTPANAKKAQDTDAAKQDQETAAAIRYVLNHYENLSIGIQSGIYDESMMRNAVYGIVVATYNRTKPFIAQMRNTHNSATLYQEFQWLANRWTRKPLKNKYPNGT